MKRGDIWKVMESRDSRESFPEGNGATVAALNLEVIFFSPCSREPASENFLPELYSPFHLDTENRIPILFRDLSPILEIVYFSDFSNLSSSGIHSSFSSSKASYCPCKNPTGKHTKKRNKDLVIGDGTKWREVHIGV